ncbi:hypothetical protein DO021_00805 [Desulfobacter hydrogenophilus]|uniref:Uncharacterized protein n=1 Tax=Desulfobacter hydrogenophilus TaxID=2291 RepID=A0A328FHD1_9BACT|nr:hypothetical protein DO021_00805 [Desulfobacter hydrogenophilus]
MLLITQSLTFGVTDLIPPMTKIYVSFIRRVNQHFSFFTVNISTNLKSFDTQLFSSAVNCIADTIMISYAIK